MKSSEDGESRQVGHDPTDDGLSKVAGLRVDVRPGPPVDATAPWYDVPAGMTDTGGDAPAELGADVAPDSEGPSRRAARQGLELIILIGVAVAIALIVKAFVVQAFFIPSESMVPTLKVQDRVLVNKLSYEFGDPERGDIVVFEAPVGQATSEIKDLIKRLIGLPGDVVEGRDGHVYINGQLLVEPYLEATVVSKTFGPYYVPEAGDVIVEIDSTTLEVDGQRIVASLQTSLDGRVDAQNQITHDHFYMLGDNRLNSKDSTEFGPVDGELFVGRAFIRVWPLGSFGLL